MKFLVTVLLSLCLCILLVGCDSIGNSNSNNDVITPPTNESTETGGETNEEQEESGENNQNKNPFAGGLENGGEFEGN